MKIKYYEKKWFMWLMLFLFAPVGIICLWKYKHYKTIPATIFTLIFGFMFLSILSPKNKQIETSNTNVIATNNIAMNMITPKPTDVLWPANTPKPTNTHKPSVPTEYKSALNKANSYANTMHMSKKGVYNQLVSEYGEKFSKEAAQYAIDNIKTDWNAHALAKAKSYQKSMNMSPSAIHDQLTSEHGEKFSQTEADYAMKHIDD